MLAIAGTIGERYIGKYAEHLAHYGSFGGYRNHTPLQTDRQYEHDKRWANTMIAHYNTYSSIPGIRSKLKDDGFYITAEDAIKWGLADKYTDELVTTD
jgi:ATP-dependent protease ClpP protease subunit